MGSVLWLECSSGISGDMCAAALLDAGADEGAVRRALASLPVEGFEVRITRVVKSGLDVCDFDVVLDAEHENHDHDMEYLHGTGCEHAHTHEGSHTHPHEPHAHEDDQGHAHAGEDGHAHAHAYEGAGAQGHAHPHEHRGMAEIASLIDAADMTPGAKAIAREVFAIIAEAEAQAHGVPVGEVHFHEVGAVDSIADVVAVAAALDSLHVEGVVVTELAEGRGTVRCQHGVIPVPVPAVVNIAAAHGLVLRVLDVRGELVTPTGAAVAAAVRTIDKLPERFTVKRVGMGAGKRAYETPGILRALIIEPVE
ncbi:MULTISPECIES: nickel insertion protein [unclassified Adlercreutzia]|uniref:nickel insertion protein n=1 Tax=unclassified Adlercreutzia TaxID=2636013 RepID=UPI0013ED7B36|nr:MULTISPECIES: nickel insertion protein [unclassified Adlercreutzia]